MDGIVLNFDAGQDQGLIRASDGKRYSFNGGDWKSASIASTGDIVDFEVEDGRATEIYLVRSEAPPAPAPAPQAPVSPEVPEVPLAPPEAAYAFRGNVPALIFAALVPISFFLPWLSIQGFSVNAWDILGNFSLADLLSGQSPAVTLVVAVRLLWLMCVLPAAAAWLIFQEFRGEATPKLRTGVGITCLASALLLLLILLHLVSQFAREFGSTVNVFSSVISILRIGWFLLIFLGIGLIAVGRGWPPFPKPENVEVDPELRELTEDESWAEESFEREERSALLRRVGLIAHVAAVPCFLLPWVTIYYQGQVAGTASGYNFIFNADPAFAVIVAILLIAVSLALAFVWNGRRRALAQAAGCGGAAILLLVEIFILIPATLAEQSARFSGASASSATQSLFEAGPNGGLWLTLVALGITTVVSWMILRNSDEATE